MKFIITSLNKKVKPPTITIKVIIMPERFLLMTETYISINDNNRKIIAEAFREHMRMK